MAAASPPPTVSFSSTTSWRYRHLMRYVNLNIHEHEWNRKKSIPTFLHSYNSISNSVSSCFQLLPLPRNRFAHRLSDGMLNFVKRKMCDLLNANEADIILPTDIRGIVCVRAVPHTSKSMRATRDNLNKFSFYRSSFMLIFFTLFFGNDILSVLFFALCLRTRM